MAVWVALLGAVNLTGTRTMRMAELREVCEGRLGFTEVRTYIQSGNVVFGAQERGEAVLARRMEDALEAHFGFRPPVILRGAKELQAVRGYEFVKRWEEGSKTLVVFLESEPAAEAKARVGELVQGAVETLEFWERQMFVYFPEGQGKSKLPMVKIMKMLGVRGTGRNRNTVVKLLEMADELAS